MQLENQKTVSATLESTKTEINKQLSEMQAEHVELVAENERLKRELFTKESLLQS